MTSVHKQVCPTCGQSVNAREEVLTRGYVEALWHVLQWCIDKNRHEFTKDDVIQYLPKQGVVENFAKLRWFGLLYNPDDINGHYGMNIDRIKKFFAGEVEVIIRLWKDPLATDPEKQFEVTERGTIDKVPNISRFQDEYRNLIVMYKTPQDPVQVGLDFTR